MNNDMMFKHILYRSRDIFIIIIIIIIITIYTQCKACDHNHACIASIWTLSLTKFNDHYYYYTSVHNWLVILSSRAFLSSTLRAGKKLTPVTLSMSLIGVRAYLSNLDVGDGSWVGTIVV